MNVIKCECCGKILEDSEDEDEIFPVEFCSSACMDIWEQGSGTRDASTISEDRLRELRVRFNMRGFGGYA